MKINTMARKVLKKKRVFLMLLLVAAGFAFSAHGVLAQTAPTVTECSFLNFSCLIDKFFYGILWFLAIILSYVAMITNWAMQPSPITTSFFVQAGWKATRDFANMFFILILLGIALDFILFNSFGVKRALPKLLLIALLINFSIPIAGVFIDFANIVSSFFLNQVSGGGFTEAIAQSVGLAKVFDANTIGTAATAINGVQNIATTANNSFINILFSIGLLAGMIFIFAALAVMFLFRTGILSVLLILLPIVLVLYAFPPSSRHFGKWMSKFTQWTMFAPTATFFLYLSMLLLIQTGSNGILSMGGTTTITESSFAYTLLRYVMVWMLMLMSLIVAQSMGITGASTAMAMWKTGTKWARGKASNYGKRGLETVGAAKVMEKAQQLAAKAPIVGGFGARILGGAAATIRSAKREAAELTKGEKDLIETGNETEVTSLIQGYAKGTPDQRAKAAKMITLAERKNKLKIRDEKGNVDFTATRKMKIELRAKAKAIGDIEAVKAIDRSDFSIAEQSINEKYDAYKKEGRAVDPDTGKPREESRHRKLAELYRKIDLGREDWDDSVVNDTFVKNALKYGALNAERFKQAQRSGNMALIDEFRTLLDKTADGKEDGEEGAAKYFMAQENAVLRGWLKKSAAKDFVGNYDHLISKLEQKIKGVEGSAGGMEQKLADEVKDWRKKKGYSENDEEEE